MWLHGSETKFSRCTQTTEQDQQSPLLFIYDTHIWSISTKIQEVEQKEIRLYRTGQKLKTGHICGFLESNESFPDEVSGWERAGNKDDFPQRCFQTPAWEITPNLAFIIVRHPTTPHSQVEWCSQLSAIAKNIKQFTCHSWHRADGAWQVQMKMSQGDTLPPLLF